MPTDEFLLDLDVEEIRKSLLEVLTYTGEKGIYLALVVMFESMVVLASLRNGYTRASTEQLRKMDRGATDALKKVRDSISHAYYNKAKLYYQLEKMLRVKAIERLYCKFFDKKDVTTLCEVFERKLRDVMVQSATQSVDSAEVLVNKVLKLIPPSLMNKYHGTSVDIALQFAYEQLTR